MNRTPRYLALSVRVTHASKHQARAKFDQTFVHKGEILSLDPANGGSELVPKNLNEDGVFELLARR